MSKLSDDVSKKLKDTKKILKVTKGSLVIWDSRTFHQNQYGKPKSEERLVQYICYLPTDNKLNTKTEQTKRLKYFNEKRTPSHWPYKINVNSLQPPTYGDDSKLIDYDNLPKIDLENEPYFNDIKKLL